MTALAPSAPQSGAPAHTPVMVQDVLSAIAPRDGGIYIDGTFGAGGYTQKLLQAADCVVIAIDRDPHALRLAEALRARYGERLIVCEGCFGDMATHINVAGVEAVDGVMLDLGVSSMQIDEAERGFSFMRDGPLDMRMGAAGMTAETLVNEADVDLLATIIAVYGEERRAKAIARAIIKKREDNRLTRTRELTDIICSILGAPHPRYAHPATRTFQALRIYLNDELGELLHGLEASARVIKAGGCLAVVSFHSLEDRMVKKYLAPASKPSRHMPETTPDAPLFKIIGKKSRTAPDDELATNRRARAARLRCAYRSDAPWRAIAPHLLPRNAPRLSNRPFSNQEKL